MKVKDHKEFACFEYISLEENQKESLFGLSDIVTRTGEDGTEIGVVIQIHDRGDLRTDMFGNAHCSELTLSTMDEITKFRSQLIPHIK